MRCQDYQRIEQAILFLDRNARRQPGLDEVAHAVRLSPFHFQRLFRKWAGISPKRFLQVVALNRAKQALDGSASVLDAALEAGLSGPARLHDLFVTHDALSPGQYKLRGAGIVIRYGFAQSPFGECLLASSPLGLCALSFVQQGGRPAALEELRARWPQAALERNDASVRVLAARTFQHLNERSADLYTEPLALHLSGTNFQVQVWRALLAIPPGHTLSYGELAELIGQPSASRALAQALKANPVAYLIPCHRVIRSTGALGGYRWGEARKLTMLAWEKAQVATGFQRNSLHPRKERPLARRAVR
jgi:AraC family transcriptional regulator of adaptative response/methylated-DNA-[protein]-cysteine methyltransferase